MAVTLGSARFTYPTLVARWTRSNAMARERTPGAAQPPRLLDRVRDAIRARHYRRRTEKPYVHSVRRFIFSTASGTLRKGAPRRSRRSLIALTERSSVQMTLDRDRMRAPMVVDRSVTVFVLSLLAAILGTVLHAEAQTAGKIYRVGIVRPASSAPLTTTDPAHFFNSGFRPELRDRGYVEGQNLILEMRSGPAKPEELSAVMGELVGLNVDVIFAVSEPAVRAAQQATRTIPIVMFAGDPVATGLVVSLARPGGNITGLSQASPELSQKRLALLKELVPRVSRVAILWNPTNPTNAVQIASAKAAAQRLGIAVQPLGVRLSQDFESAFLAATHSRAEALITLDDLLVFNHREQIIALAAKTRLPAVYGWGYFPETGGLMSYGPDFVDLYRRAAVFVDKILKGAKPGDLPVEQPTKFELVINLKAAKALGLMVPSSLRLQAERILE
jgi:putative ABC transport system substrate-binding protein